MKVLICGLFVLLSGSLIFSATAVGADLCEKLENYRLVVDGNGYQGITSPEGLKLKKEQDGSFSFETYIQMDGEPKDKVVGKCKDRHIVFTRTREGSFKQVYDGWIFQKGDFKIGGTFSHNGQTKWGWCGSRKPPEPK